MGRTETEPLDSERAVIVDAGTQESEKNKREKLFQVKKKEVCSRTV
jgi:hypothetical protein